MEPAGLSVVSSFISISARLCSSFKPQQGNGESECNSIVRSMLYSCMR